MFKGNISLELDRIIFKNTNRVLKLHILVRSADPRVSFKLCEIL